MPATGTPAENVLNALALHNEYLIGSMHEHALDDEVSAIIDDLAESVGGQEIVLAIGGLIHNVHHGSGLPIPEHPNLYDFTVVTPKIIAQVYGEIYPGGHQQEQSIVLARKHVSEVSVVKRPGDTDENGNVALAHELKIGFVDGNKVRLPELEEDLTPAGRESLAKLVSSLYADLAN